MPAIRRVEAIIATLHFDDKHAARGIDDEEVDLARTDAVRVLDEQILDNSPRALGKRCFEHAAKGKLRLVRRACGAFGPDFVRDGRDKCRHSASVTGLR